MHYFIHHVPGRLRVKLPALKGKHNRTEEIQALLNSRAGIRVIEVNQIAGCVVVHYDPACVTADELLETLKEAGHLDLAGPISLFHGAAPDNMTRAIGNQALDNSEYLHVATRVGELFGKALANVFMKNVLEQTVFSLLTLFFASGGRGRR